MKSTDRTHKPAASAAEERARLLLRRYYDGETTRAEERELAAAFGIQSIPTLLFIPMEGQPRMARGALPKETLEEAIDSVLLAR